MVVLAGFFVNWLIFLFRKVFLNKSQIAAARARFARALCKLHNLKEEFYINKKLEYFLREDARLADGKYQGNPIGRYEYLIDEIGKILYAPEGYLKRKAYDPVSGNLLQEEEEAQTSSPYSDDEVIVMQLDDHGMYSSTSLSGSDRDAPFK